MMQPQQGYSKRFIRICLKLWIRCVCIARGWGDKLLGMVSGMEEDGSTGTGYDGYVDDQTEAKDIGAYVYAVFAK